MLDATSMIFGALVVVGTTHGYRVETYIRRVATVLPELLKGLKNMATKAELTTAINNLATRVQNLESELAAAKTAAATAADTVDDAVVAQIDAIAPAPADPAAANAADAAANGG